VVDVISKGAADRGRWRTGRRRWHNAKFDFGFAVDWMRKDLSMALDAARQHGARLPLTALVDQFYGTYRLSAAVVWTVEPD
jgi:3-hydroxyisobutyrate dehydrogenase-like beta-hydroxyacid dehydrogenase